MKKGILKRVAASALAAMTVLSMAACGEEKSNVPQKEWVYVPEFKTIDGENIDYYDMRLVGEELFYMSYNWDEETMVSSQNICKYALADGTISEVPITWQDATADQNIGEYCLGQDGSIYAMVYSYATEPNEEGYYDSKELLCKFDAGGKQLFSIDMAEYTAEDPENSYINSMTVDGNGRMYVASNNIIWLFDTEGTYKGTVSVGNAANAWINAIGSGKDGKVYACSYSHDGTSSGYQLIEIDFDGKTTGASYANFPSGNGRGLVSGIEQDFLVHDGTSVYEYDMETQTKTAVFDWLDCDINGSTVQNIGVLADGRILAIIEDWESDDRGLAFLTKTKASEVAQKETIVVATMSGGGSELQAAAVAFNKSNDNYRISIKQYLDYDNWSENTWSDAMTNLLNDITSSNCPDIIDLTGLNINQLAAKDVFVDLNKYLEKSQVLNREDFIENILNACTYDEKLVTIPSYFELMTVIGSTEKVGADMGWTLQELIAFADQYPEAQLFDRMSKNSILYYLMMYNENLFIDWATGKCKFDTDEFKSLLSFVNRFPDEVDWEQGQASTPTRIQNGEVLLDTAYIYNFESIQIYWEMFGGDVTCIGFPSVDSNSGCALMMGQAYGITTKSKKQDGAWEFIESMFTKEDNGDWWYGFPTLKAKLEAMKEDAMKLEYVTDENGEPILDENGEPIVMGGGSGVGYEDGWEYTYTVPTQKEVDIILSLMDVAQPVSGNSESQITDIINEEAAAYWAGQKSVDEVANIIQSRIQIYVDENR